MARDHLLVIDQGTTSTRAVVYDSRLRPVGQSQLRFFLLILGRDGSSTIPTRSSLGRVAGHRCDARCGDQGGPDRGHRTDQSAGDDDRVGTGHRPSRSHRPWSGKTAARPRPASDSSLTRADVARQTGLVIDPYFSATKIAWILDHVPHARERARSRRARRGNRRHVRDLAPDRRHAVCHRRDQRIAHAAHGPAHDTLVSIDSAIYSGFRRKYWPRFARARAISA